MVLMSDRSAEEGKYAVARALGNIALIAMNGVHHELKGGIDDAAGFLWIEVFYELHGALDVGEEGGDGPPLALRRRLSIQSCLLGEDTFCQVRGGIA
jgi:hypothetical protein